MGSKGALPKPCNARNNTNWPKLSAEAQSNPVTVNAAMEHRNTRRRPKLTASQPDTVVPSADATIKAVTTHPT